MKIDALTRILTCVNLLFVHGVHLDPQTKRILYGQPAVASDFPFLVRLATNTGTACSGAIIAEHWILTAGHCVSGQVCSEVLKIFPAVWPYPESITPVDCFAHYDYTKFAYVYDIGLISVANNLLLDGRLKAIPLPYPGTTYDPGTRAVFAGWGQTEHNSYPSYLVRADLVIQEWDVCNKDYREALGKFYLNQKWLPSNIPRRIVCVHGLGSPPAGSCFGDSGGPIVINGEAAGIDSFGMPDEKGCRVGAPESATSVVDYLPWIYRYIAPGMDTTWIHVQPEPVS